MQTLGSSRRLTADERKAILDQQLAAAVARGGEEEWWGRGPFEAVVSYHRYLPGRPWDYVFPLLFLGRFVTGSASPDLADELRPIVGFGALALWAGGIVSWAGRTRYERWTIDEDGGVTVAGVGLLAGAAAMTLVAGLAGTSPALPTFSA